MFKLKQFIFIFLVGLLTISFANADSAIYSSTYGAPWCENITISCVANESLLAYAGGYTESEPNYPNSIDSCGDNGDGAAFIYGKYLSVESSDGNNITAGNNVTINADGISLDGRIFYTSNVSTPDWKHVYHVSSGTFNPIYNFTLDNVVGYHAIRFAEAGFGLSSSTDYCYDDEYDSDVDDLVFYVKSASTSSCSYSGTGNWTIDLSDDCVINTDYDLGANNIILSGTGNVTFNSSINVTNFPEPATNQNIYIDSDAYILIS